MRNLLYCLLLLWLIPFSSEAQSGRITLQNGAKGIFRISLTDVPSLSTTKVMLPMGDGNYVHWSVRLDSKGEYTTIKDKGLKGLQLKQLSKFRPVWELTYPYQRAGQYQITMHVTCNSANGSLEHSPDKEPLNEFESFPVTIPQGHPGQQGPQYLQTNRKGKKKDLTLHGNISPERNPARGDTILVCLKYRPSWNGQVALSYDARYFDFLDWTSADQSEDFSPDHPSLGLYPGASGTASWASLHPPIRNKGHWQDLQLKKRGGAGQQQTLRWTISQPEASGETERGLFVYLRASKQMPRDTERTVILNAVHTDNGVTTKRLKLAIEISKSNDPNNILPNPRRIDFYMMPQVGMPIRYFINLENVGGKSEDSIYQQFTIPKELNFYSFQILQAKIPANAKPLVQCSSEADSPQPCYEVSWEESKRQVTVLYRNFNLRGRQEVEIRKKERVYTQGVILAEAHTESKDRLKKRPIVLRAQTIFGRDTLGALSTKGKTRYRADWRLGIRAGLRFGQFNEVKFDSTFSVTDRGILGLSLKPYSPAPRRLYPEFEVNLRNEKVANPPGQSETYTRHFYLEGTTLLRYNLATFFGLGAGVQWGEYDWSNKDFDWAVHQLIGEVSTGIVGHGLGVGLRYYHPLGDSQREGWEAYVAVRF